VFSELAALLAGDFRLLAPDLPGHGNSSPAVQNDLAGLSADLSCWLDAVVNDPIVLVGWSLGGMLAMEMAAQKVLPVDRLVLIGTTPRFTLSNDWAFGLPSTQIRALARNLDRRFEATLADFFTLAFAGEQIAMERLRTIRAFAVKRSPLPDRSATLGLLNMLAVQDQREILPAITQPVMLLHGDLDQISPITAGQYLSETLSKGHIETFPGVGHGPFLSQPLIAAAKIREFC
jgi:pimeloyl-[acyl-carrier protein] methyl ester esterase